MLVMMNPMTPRPEVGLPSVASAAVGRGAATPRTLIVLSSYHHKNTEKVAKVLAETLDADIVPPQDVKVAELGRYDLIGFGSGIYDAKHHLSLLDLADRLPDGDGKRAFIFSTSAIMGRKKVAKDHSALRDKLRGKRYTVVDEFACKGYNTNSFLRHIGGMNRRHPDAEDLESAARFARGLRGDGVPRRYGR
jgi:flavodoxin